VALLNQIWTALSPLINLFTPTAKAAHQNRRGAKVTKTYDTAQTPYQRLLAHPETLDEVDARTLAALLEATNPAAARRQVGQLCATLLQRVRRKPSLPEPKPPTSTDPEPRSTRRQSSGHLQMSQRIPRNGQVDMTQQARVDGTRNLTPVGVRPMPVETLGAESAPRTPAFGAVGT
jgi:hypothetical protein